MANYWTWIAAHQPTNPRGMCVETTKQMAEVFPELRRVRGHYVCPLAGRRPHWWLVTPSGEVIDPTLDQFPSMGVGDYEEYTGPEPTGHCLNCNALLFGESYACNDACAVAFAEHCMGGGTLSINGTQVWPAKAEAER